MITNEIVRSVMTNGRVLTSGGVRRCAGNADIVTGGCVTVLNDMIIGWRRRTGAVMTPTLTRYYHFADAALLKMYYVDTDFAAVVRTEDIAPPAKNSFNPVDQTSVDPVLLLHCYNDDVEYFVWLHNPTSLYWRCFIQRDGVVIADFVTNLSADSTPDDADAEINSDGDLVWVALSTRYTTETEFTFANHKNGELTETHTHRHSDAESAIVARTDSKMLEAVDAATIILSDLSTVTKNMRVAGGVGTNYGIIYDIQYTGLQNKKDHARASSRWLVYDLWGENAYLQEVCVGGWDVMPMIEGWALNVDGSVNQISYAETAMQVEAQVSWLTNAKYAVTVSEQVPANAATLSGSLTQSRQITRSFVRQDVIAGAVSVTAASTTQFPVTLNFPEDISNDPVSRAIDGMTITFTSGNNSGQSRLISSFTGGLYINCAALGETPKSGDAFTIAIEVYDSVDVTATTDYTLSASIAGSSMQTETKFDIDIGKGYILNHEIQPLEYGDIAQVLPTIKRGNAIIYTGEPNNYNYLTRGSWMTAAGEMTGIYNGKLIMDDGASQTDTDITLFGESPSIVTKRVT